MTETETERPSFKNLEQHVQELEHIRRVGQGLEDGEEDTASNIRL